MNLLDAAIILLVLIAAARGIKVGFFRQAGSLGGFIVGVIIGALVSPYFVHMTSSGSMKALIALGTIFILGILVSTLGEVLGIIASQRLQHWQLGVLDMGAGAALGVIIALFSVWVASFLLGRAPIVGLAIQIQRSAIIRFLDGALPPAPDFLATIERFLDPSGFPRVFTGLEPSPAAPVTGPNAAAINAAAAAGKAATVRIEGSGCGGIVEGSGFVVAAGLVASNAHVVAGATHPVVIDDRGTHDATVVLFDPNLDFSLLRVAGLAAGPLPLATADVTRGTVGAVLGYPGGGPFTVSSAAVLDKQEAVGRNIYDRGIVHRTVYELQAEVHPGNSGGPFITPDGVVVGVVFAASSTTDGVGYALTSTEIMADVNQAKAYTGAVDTGACASE